MKPVLFIDTCVWLDLAKSKADELIISVIEELMKSNQVIVIMTDLIKTEFARNKKRVAESSTQRYTQEFKLVRKIIQTYADMENREKTLSAIDEVSHKLPLLSDTVYFSINRIEEIFRRSLNVVISNYIKLKAIERATQKKAPFHKNKNSMDDALLIETYGALLNKNRNKDYKFIFVSYNVNDFSDPNDNRKSHSDISDLFDGEKSKYFINIVDAIKEIDHELLEVHYNEHEWYEESRGLREIIEFIDEYTDKIWYGRHGLLVESVEKGETEIIPDNQYSTPNPKTIKAEIWKGACAAARKVEEKYPDDLGPWDDFEWGMLSGKLSALRWILGDEWDMLDT
jgi:hypothetical protein